MDSSTFQESSVHPGIHARHGTLQTFWLKVMALDRMLVAVLLVTLVLGFVRLDRYPATWFDEGSYLEVSKNIAEDGLYAARSGDGTLDYAPVIGVGPTMLVPVAAALWVGDSSLLAGRIIAVLFLLVATALYWVVTRWIFGRNAAIFAVLVLFTMPALRWIPVGRQVLGEVPAMMFLLLGGILAFRSQSRAATLGAGAVLGLAMVTKPQYLPLLPATIICVAAIDYFDRRTRHLTWYATLLAGIAISLLAWAFMFSLIVGPGDVIHEWRVLRDTSNQTLVVLDLDRITANLRFLLGPRSFFLVAPATIAGAVAYWKAEGDRRLAILSLVVFQCIWLGWFTIISVGWARYAFAALVISTMLIGALASVALTALQSVSFPPRTRAQTLKAAVSAAAVAGVLLLCLAGSWRVLAPIALEPRDDPQRFARAVEQTVPPGATIAGWEPEITFLTDRELVYPPIGSLATVIAAVWDTSVSVDHIAPNPQSDYLVVGEFGRWVGIYEAALARGDYSLVLSVDNYELYERVR